MPASIILPDPVKHQVMPWEKISWSESHINAIYRDWGLYLKHKSHMKGALEYFSKAYDLKDDDYITLFHRSGVKRSMANPEEAYLDGLLAQKIVQNNCNVDLEISDAIYECNRLEDAKIKLSNDTCKYAGTKAEPFVKRVELIDENLMDSLGDSLGPFILKHEKIFPTVIEEQRKKHYIDPRPLWKQLRDEGKCDILSIPDAEELLLSPREIARRERTFRVMNQIYLNKTWEDVIFLKELESNSNFLLPYAKLSYNVLMDLLCENNIAIKKFVKMLQVRSPLYNELMLRCPNLKIADKHREKYLYRVQYQTRRNMIIILRNIYALRKMGNIKKLVNYTESVMGDYVVLKTHRVMPWKFEFLYDVYNNLALAYTDFYDLTLHNPHSKIGVLLRLPKEKYKDINLFVFGKKPVNDNEVYNAQMALQKQFLERMRRRLHFSKHNIEIAYIFHEMAKSQFHYNNYDKCVSVARKSISAAKECNSLIWAFLSSMLIVKSHASLRKIEYLQDALNESLDLAILLKSQKLIDFINQCKVLNQVEVETKRGRSMDVLRKSRTKINSSSISIFSLNKRSSDQSMAFQKLEEDDI